ncbi:MAG: methyltransferase domain-containing protein [Alphaproteobacteria bacterium]|nr:methyltransferase domain-containing protein [Alphaproteobacteria bacterium]
MNQLNSQLNAKAYAAFQEAHQLFEQSRLDDALRALDLSLSHQPSAIAWRIKGFIYKLQGRKDDAMAALESSLALNPQDHGSLSLLAEMRVAENDITQAIGLYVLAIAAAPSVISHKENFLLLAGGTPFTKYNPQTADALVACLKTPEVECGGAQILWLSLFEKSPGIGKIYKNRMSGAMPAFDPSGLKPGTDLSALDTPLFLEGLRRIAVHYPAFEQFLIQLRRQLLLAGPDKTSPLHLRIAAALAHYCFYTEYIFDFDAEEQAAAEALRQAINGGDTNIAALCLYACYAPLAALADPAAAARSLSAAAEPLAQSLAAVQITEPLALEADKKSIPALTSIDNDVSQRVRAQYEEFPYPRWKQLSGSNIDADIMPLLAGRKLRILVAGCGTGREALNTATLFPDADVLAVDLSLTSLAYARGRAQMHGITNVDFRHGDILKLGALDEKFDYITSSGVLHHLADPEAGWKILRGLLKPQGLMRIALYSERGRKAVVSAHNAIRKGGYSDDAAGMRRFRKDMPQLLSAEGFIELISFGDFYHLSMFRDLLFHVQEHRFDPPRIRRALGDNDLAFLKLATDKETEALYQKTFGAAPQTLENWDTLEQQNPALFRTMYVIWCQSKT